MDKLYIIMPAGFKTGGTELGHQLAFYYSKKHDFDVILAYTGVKEGICPVNGAFKEYVDKWVAIEDIIDNKDSVIIFPETMVNLLSRYKNAKK